MNNHTVAALGMLMILASTAVSALERNDTSIGQTGVTDSQNETVSLSPIEQTRARAWELSDAQWRRYKSLMQGIRGSISPATISPIEVLGIHARDDEERRRYAQRWTRLMREDVGRILAFQQAYDEAGKRLYPNEPVIDPARLPGGSKKTIYCSRATAYSCLSAPSARSVINYCVNCCGVSIKFPVLTSI